MFTGWGFMAVPSPAALFHLRDALRPFNSDHRTNQDKPSQVPPLDDLLTARGTDVDGSYRVTK